MRWDGQRLGADDDASLPGLPVGRGIPGLLRTVTTPEFAGIRFHEVLAKSLLNHVPAASGMPFGWTINTFRGCSHACTYCFARGTHAYLDLDTGADFDREIVVKTNAVEVLQREPGPPVVAARARRARHEHRPVPARRGSVPADARGDRRARRVRHAVLRAHQGHAAAPRPAAAAGRGGAGARRRRRLARGARRRACSTCSNRALPASPRGSSLVRAVREAGLPCGVFLAPVLPALTDGLAHLDHALASLAAAGATGVTVVPLHLRPGTKEWFMGWLERERPEPGAALPHHVRPRRVRLARVPALAAPAGAAAAGAVRPRRRRAHRAERRGRVDGLPRRQPAARRPRTTTGECRRCRGGGPHPGLSML
nr:hypothetical protein [Angustibacter aerolatus]